MAILPGTPFNDNNTFNGGATRSEIKGGAEDDLINLDAGTDIGSGGAGDDRIQGFAGNDLISGDGGNDQLEGGDDGDAIYGGSGNDTLLGETGTDVLLGLDGDDNLDGGADAFDVVDGGGGNDRIFGGNDAVTDVLRGGLGSDTFVILGNDYLFPGDYVTGVDKMVFSNALVGGAIDGALTQDQFVLGTASTQAIGQILYDQTTGIGSWDDDGIGPNLANPIFTLPAGTPLVFNDLSFLSTDPVFGSLL